MEADVNEIYLNIQRSREQKVPYFNDRSKEISLHADRVFKMYEAGHWDIRHRQFLQPLALDHKILKCIPGSGPGWWKVVEIKNA